MAFGHGKNATLTIDDKDNTSRDISAAVQTVSLTRPADVAEVTVLGDTAKDYVAGVPEGGALSASGVWDATTDGYIDGILGNDSIGSALGDYSMSPDGGTTTYSGKHIVTSYTITIPVDGATSFSMGSQLSGAVSRA